MSGKELSAFDVAYFTASCDPVETNEKFATSLKLDYPILSDPGKEVAKAYGVLTAKGYSRRWTIIIGTDGKILKIDKDVQFRSHGKDLVKALEELGIDKAK